MLLRKIFTISRLIFSGPSDPKISQLHNYFIQEAGVLNPVKTKRIIAVQGIEVPFYYAILGQITLNIRRRINISGSLLLIRSLAVGKSFRALLGRNEIISYLKSAQWARINKEIVGNIGYRSHSFNYFFKDLTDLWSAYINWCRLENTNEIIKFEIHNILVGDLIIDSYLRFKPSASFQLKDRFVWRIIWQAYRDIRRANAFFSNHKPVLYLSSYSSYIQHGVPVRVALANNVPVYVFGSSDVFGKKLTSNDFFHTASPETSNYKILFDRLDHQEERLYEASKQLDLRLSGGIDHATRYMKISAYAKSSETVPDVKNAVVVFLHDFLDSYHIFDQVIFHDFWEWVVCTIETLVKYCIPFYLKPHPNQIPESEQAVILLMEKYPDVKMISSRITNTQLVDAGMICGVTVYGTVAVELAYMGIPTIACARHLYNSFDFCRTAKSLEEYINFLKNPKYRPLPISEMRRQALTFFYMDKIYGGDNLIDLRYQLSELQCVMEDNEGDSRAMINELKKLQDLASYKNLIDNLVVEINNQNI